MVKELNSILGIQGTNFTCFKPSLGDGTSLQLIGWKIMKLKIIDINIYLIYYIINYKFYK